MDNQRPRQRIEAKCTDCGNYRDPSTATEQRPKGEFVPEMGWVARCDGYLLERKPGVFEWDETNAVDNEKHGLIVELLASTQENISVNNKYPHKCTRCDYPAYVGAWDIDCSNPNCPTKS